MPHEETGSPNTVKYSIWQTKTEEIDPKVKEKMIDSANSPNQKPKNTE